jgi:hypothetical protein
MGRKQSRVGSRQSGVNSPLLVFFDFFGDLITSVIQLDKHQTSLEGLVIICYLLFEFSLDLGVLVS